MHCEPIHQSRSKLRPLLAVCALVLRCAGSVSAADSVAVPVYRVYSDAVAKPYATSVATLEKQFHVLPAPGPLTGPTWVEYPKPFDLDLRRGRTNLKLVAFVITDATGKLVQLYAIGASDMTVARVAGVKLSHAKWHPARLGNIAVGSAAIWEFDGAGILN